MDSAFPVALLIPAVIVGLIILNYIAVTIQERREGKTGSAPAVISLEVNLEAVNDPEFLESMAAGQKINAIKRYREFTGVGLKEAKDIVEYIEKHPDEDFSLKGKKKKNDLSLEDDVLPSDEGIRELLRHGSRLEAINAYRQFTGSSLGEAKEAIERIEMDMNQPFEDDNSLSSRR